MTGRRRRGGPIRAGGARALALAGAAMLAACPDATRRPTDSPKETSMDDSLRTLDQHPSVAISIRQGTEHFRNGVVTLTVRGDGRVEVDQLRAGQATHHQTQLAPARIRELGRTLAEHRVAAPRQTTLPRQPGDSPLVLRVEGAGAPFQADLWYGDRHQDRDLDAIIRLADALVKEVGAGAVGQP